MGTSCLSVSRRTHASCFNPQWKLFECTPPEFLLTSFHGKSVSQVLSLKHDFVISMSVFGLREEVREALGLQSRVASAEKPLGVHRTFLEESVLKSLSAPVSLWLKRVV